MYERTNERTAEHTKPLFRAIYLASQRKGRPRIRSIRPVPVGNLNPSTATGTLHSESHITNGPCAAAVRLQSIALTQKQDAHVRPPSLRSNSKPHSRAVRLSTHQGAIANGPINQSINRSINQSKNAESMIKRSLSASLASTSWFFVGDSLGPWCMN